jgi:hypothetical protein
MKSETRQVLEYLRNSLGVVVGLAVVLPVILFVRWAWKGDPRSPFSRGR